MHTLAFFTWNHNPIAKRIIDLLAQYTFGRRFKVSIKDARKKKCWEDFDRKYAIRENVSKFWIREYCIYGEIMLNTDTWQLIDPSTVWDIITDPDDIKNVYYYYQSYPTAYQMFTGFKVKGAPGSEKVPGQEYIIRELPAYKVLHHRGNCVSNEKRGRSLLFPILGWLKRIRDLYNAIVIRQWLLSCFIWDDTVKGSAAEIATHAAACRAGVSVDVWMTELATIRAKYSRPDEPIADPVTCLSKKIQADADTTDQLVQAMADGEIDQVEAQRILQAVENQRKTLDLIEASVQFRAILPLNVRREAKARRAA